MENDEAMYEAFTEIFGSSHRDIYGNTRIKREDWDAFKSTLDAYIDARIKRLTSQPEKAADLRRRGEPESGSRGNAGKRG